MGFKNVWGDWIYTKGKAKEASLQQAKPTKEGEEARDETIHVEEEDIEEEREEARDSLLEEVMQSVEEHLPLEARAFEEPSIAEAAPPPPPAEPSSTHAPSHRPTTQSAIPNLRSLKAFMTSSISKLEASITSQVQALNQRLDNLENSLNFKLDTIISLVESTQPPNPFTSKMKGVVIHDKSKSSSTQSFHPIHKSPPRPFQDPISAPSTSRPQPSPQPSPKPSPQPSPKPTPRALPQTTLICQ